MCILTQNAKAMSYASRYLKKHEHNYHTYDIEFAPAVFALEFWRHFFEVFGGILFVETVLILSLIIRVSFAIYLLSHIRSCTGGKHGR
jgi:hypothetical protein